MIAQNVLRYSECDTKIDSSGPCEYFRWFKKHDVQYVVSSFKFYSSVTGSEPHPSQSGPHRISINNNLCRGRRIPGVTETSVDI